MTGKVTIVFQLILEEEQTGILERRTDRNWEAQTGILERRADRNWEVQTGILKEVQTGILNWSADRNWEEHTWLCKIDILMEIGKKEAIVLLLK